MQSNQFCKCLLNPYNVSVCQLSPFAFYKILILIQVKLTLQPNDQGKWHKTPSTLHPEEREWRSLTRVMFSDATTMWRRDNGTLQDAVAARPLPLFPGTQGASTYVQPMEAADVGAAVPPLPPLLPWGCVKSELRV